MALKRNKGVTIKNLYALLPILLLMAFCCSCKKRHDNDNEPTQAELTMPEPIATIDRQAQQLPSDNQLPKEEPQSQPLVENNGEDQKDIVDVKPIQEFVVVEKVKEQQENVNEELDKTKDTIPQPPLRHLPPPVADYDTGGEMAKKFWDFQLNADGDPLPPPPPPPPMLPPPPNIEEEFNGGLKDAAIFAKGVMEANKRVYDLAMSILQNRAQIPSDDVIAKIKESCQETVEIIEQGCTQYNDFATRANVYNIDPEMAERYMSFSILSAFAEYRNYETLFMINRYFCGSKELYDATLYRRFLGFRLSNPAGYDKMASAYREAGGNALDLLNVRNLE